MVWFVLLINRQAEAIEKNKINKLRRDAIIAFGKLSLEEMRKCLRLFGVSADTMSNELVESTLFSLVDKQPQNFFSQRCLTFYGHSSACLQLSSRS